MSEIAWGIFAATTFVLLVLFPGRTLLVVCSIIGVVAVIFGAAASWQQYSIWQSERDTKRVQAVVIKNERTCTDQRQPHQYSIINGSEKTIEASSISIKIRKAGFSTIIALEDFTSDAILKPGDGVSYCFGLGDANQAATAGLESQEWVADVTSVRFAE